MLSFIHPAICQAGFLQSELPSVNRTGFTELLNWGNASNSQVDKKVNIIFVHGLRGHPLETWTSSLPSTIKSKFSYLQNIRLFRSISSLFSNGQEKRVFWPRDFLAEDIPQARVWTFGYNADVVELFLANNANSVSVHGSNLAIQLEREVDNEASPSVSNTRVSRLINAKQDPIIFVAHSLGGILVKDVRSEASSSNL
ncbi:uncharacterized protein KY384_005624 [Bacidia gigantensis]|uniref:uncharacterized protein n=1 Tax=Bacidia gigantensis TaxID=2732470 RepID=UPI001D0555F0|nr:uncharacterized protein KY384_005624 [Bacidia gigantensis]KAG8530141.1 hypothetical protein KY384_005624 [Bacidia gigantensis]